MSKNVTLKKAERRLKIKELLPLGNTYEEIAEACGVTHRTINRDIKAWHEEGGFEEWLLSEFFRLHSERQKGDWKTRYTTIARLLEKTLKQKISAEVEGSIVIKAWDLGNVEGSPT